MDPPKIPDPADIPKIQILAREMWDLRRQLNAARARETIIVNELRTLNAPPIPDFSSGDDLQGELVLAPPHFTIDAASS